MQKRILLSCLVWLILIVGTTAQAQTQGNSPPLIVLMEGNLWSWEESSGALRQLTVTGYNFRPIISPDGTRIAYSAINEIGVRVLEGGFVGDSPMPSDLWVMEIDTGRAIRIAGQPPGASITDTPTNFVIRSEPAWSAGGNIIAWSELALPDFVHRLMLYDLINNITTTITTLPEPAAYPGPAKVIWAGDWLAAHTTLYDAGANVITDAILTFTVTGSPLADVRLSYTIGGNDYLIDMYPIMQQFQPYIGIIYASGSWQLIDPLTGLTQILAAPPEQFSLLAPNPDNSAFLQFWPDTLNEQRIMNWLFVMPSAQTAEILPYRDFSLGIALSPDGDSAAYIGTDALYIWRNGQAQRIAGTGGALQGYTTLSWAPMGMRAPVLDQGGGIAVTCPGFMPSRLFAGGSARVTPGDPNNIRTAPGYANASLGLIPGGNQFIIISGPMCADNTAWWLVDYAGVRGWVAEGTGNIYWLEMQPFFATATPFFRPTAPPTCNMPPHLSVGTSAEVTFGPSNNLRASPGLEGAVTAQLEGGRIVTVFSGPVCVDGINWWEVGEPFVYSGWTAEGQNGEYWLVPVICPNGMYSRLAPNRIARVSPGAPNNLRDLPPSGGVTSIVIERIPGGASFSVLDGPRCGADGLMYWQVNYDGMIGWTAEGDSGVYWLEP